MALLDIVITHRDEPWGVGRKMFEMLKLQRGVREDEFRVILVQDGEEGNTLKTEQIIRNYPFVDTLLTIPQGGVSAARNAGLDAAESEWVMFCDFDDMLYSCDSLFRILESIRQAGKDADLLWSSFWIEMLTTDGKWLKRGKEWNSVFIHGKVYRREFLIGHGIRFDEELCYSEDAMFNALAVMECDQKRIARIPETVYMWCYRSGSLSNYEGGDAKRNLSLYRKRVKMIDAFDARGMTYDAKCTTVRTLMDYYWEINGRDEAPGHTKEEWIRLLQEEVIPKHPGALMDISVSDRKELFRITKEEASAKRFIRDGMPEMEDWFREIGAL